MHRQWPMVVLVLAIAATAWFFTVEHDLLRPGPSPEPLDILISGGVVLDGSGEPRFRADVGIRDGRIAAVGDLSRYAAEERLDASELFVAPGFINTHSHSDEWLAEGRSLTPSLAQGITTELVGVDGESVVEVAAHLEDVGAAGVAVNYGTLVGHGALRRAVGARQAAAATPEQLEAMRQLLGQAMKDGAFGLSTGLEYEPGRHASTAELTALAAVAAEHGGLYSSHIRDEGSGMAAAVAEAIAVGREAGTPVVISHIKVRRDRQWPEDAGQLVAQLDEAMDAIQTARQQNVAVWADIYPYRVTWVGLRGTLALARQQQPLEDLIISQSSENQWLDRRLTDLAGDWEVTPREAAGRILARDPDARVAVKTIPQASLQHFLTAPFTMVASDNASPTGRWSQPGGPASHPRSYGTYPRFLGTYVREQGLISWEEAVHKAAGLPAHVFGLQERGLIREEHAADLVIFDPQTVADRASYARPERFPAGIHYVLVNGRLAMSHGQRLDTVHDNEEGPVRAGQILRHTPAATP